MNLNTLIYGNVSIMNLLLAAAILLFSVLLSKGATIYLRRMLKDKMSADQMQSISKVVYYGIILFAIIGSLGQLGIDLSGVMVAGGIAGIVIGFASQSIVSNLISGIFLLIERPIKIGDQVDIDDKKGFVEDISIISTTLRTYDGLYIRIPNEKVFTTSITNYVSHIARRFEYSVGIRYSDDAQKAIKIIESLIEDQPLALVNPKPQAFVDSLGDNSVNIVVRLWAPATNWYDLKMKMLWEIKKTLEENGIEIAFPQRVLWLGDNPMKAPGPAENIIPS